MRPTSMRRPSTLFTGLFTGILLAVTSPTPTASAAPDCSCESITLQDEFDGIPDGIDAIFVGHQTDRTVDASSGDLGIVTFDVSAVYLGEVAREYSVATPWHGPCAVDLAGADSVGIAVELVDGDRRVDCGSVVDVDELDALFGPSEAPMAAPPPSTTEPAGDGDNGVAARIGLITLLTAVVIAGGIMIVRQRRSG